MWYDQLNKVKIFTDIFLIIHRYINKCKFKMKDIVSFFAYKKYYDDLTRIIKQIFNINISRIILSLRGAQINKQETVIQQ